MLSPIAIRTLHILRALVDHPEGAQAVIAVLAYMEANPIKVATLTPSQQIGFLTNIIDHLSWQAMAAKAKT